MTESASSFGILATTRYLPRLRLQRADVASQHRWMAPGLKSLARGERTLANWDEDVVTMAVEAGRQLLAGLDAQPGSLTLASTTLPFADRINAGIAAAALGLPANVAVRDVASSARAATTELLAALTEGAAAPRLLVAAERRVARPASTQELLFGDGAAGVLTGAGHPLATLVAAHTVHADMVDHFRETGSGHDYGWEERWVRDEGYLKIAVDAISACLAVAGVAAAQFDHFVMPAALPKVNEAVAKRCGIGADRVASTGFDTCGDLGCAQPLSMLDAVLRGAAPSALILLVGFGNGCDAMLLRRTARACPGPVPLPGKPESSYMKYLSFTGQLQLEWGMRAEMDNKTALSAAWRDSTRIARFEGGSCERCGTVQFPRARMCVNPECSGVDTQQPRSLADTTAKVLSHTCDYLAYTPSPPFLFGHIDFDGGGRVLMEFTDTDADELSVGLPVRMVYRIKDIDSRRGFRRYFWKATPIRPGTPQD